jgi:hypothetical protein
MADDPKPLSLEDAKKAAVDAINDGATKVEITRVADDKFTVTSSKPE